MFFKMEFNESNVHGSQISQNPDCPIRAHWCVKSIYSDCAIAILLYFLSCSYFSFVKVVPFIYSFGYYGTAFMYDLQDWHTLLGIRYI